MIKVGIIGATGYAGNEIVRLLLGHKDVKIVWFGSRSYIDQKYADVYRNMFQLVDDVCMDDNMEELANQVDVIFTATPQGLCASLVNDDILNKVKIIDLSADFRLKDVNIYEKWYKIEHKAPQYIDEAAKVSKCIIGEGTEIYGTVENSVIGSCVTIGEGAVVKDSIIMNGVTIEAGAYVEKGIIAENVKVGANAKLGVGEEAVNEMKPNIYAFGLVTIGENSVIPEGVTIGKNTAIFGDTDPSDYPDGTLPSGGSIIKAGE